MGRIVTSVRVESVADASKSLLCDALVDTGASHLVLPSAWRERLGELELIETVDTQLADGSLAPAEVCGPVRIQLEGFRHIYNEVLFVEMNPADGIYEPLVGYLVLEQSQAAVDVIGHRLLKAKSLDLK